MKTDKGSTTTLVGRWLAVATTICLVATGGAVAAADPPSLEPGAVIVARSLPYPLSPGEQRTPSGAVGTPRSCPDQPRSEIDRPDIVEGPSIHVVYLVAADSPDQLLDTSGTFNCTMEAQNMWMEEQSGRRWNLDVFEFTRSDHGRKTTARALDVTFARSELPAAELGGATAVRDELIRLGFAQPDKRYLTYVMGPYTTSCGDAIYPVGLHPGERRDGAYAQVYLSSTNACNAQWFGTPGNPSWSDAIAQQELLHTEGLTAIGAPRSCPTILPFAHICTAALFYTEESLELDPERLDLMYPYMSVPLSQKVLDRGHDDYFDHDLPLADLADSPYLVPATAD